MTSFSQKHHLLKNTTWAEILTVVKIGTAVLIKSNKKLSSHIHAISTLIVIVVCGIFGPKNMSSNDNRKVQKM